MLDSQVTDRSATVSLVQGRTVLPVMRDSSRKSRVSTPANAAFYRQAVGQLHGDPLGGLVTECKCDAGISRWSGTVAQERHGKAARFRGRQIGPAFAHLRPALSGTKPCIST